MYKLKIITPTKARQPWIKECLKAYQNRLKKDIDWEWIFVKKLSPLLLKKEPYLSLTPEGTLFNSSQFSTFLLNQLQENHSRLTFLIGDAQGLPNWAKEKSHYQISLSPLTFTHEMTYCIFIEQVYRALQIAKKSPYHK